MHRADIIHEVCDELAFVPALVLDDVAIDVSTKVVHNELPLAAEVPMAEGHLRIERRRIRHQEFHAHFVMDLAEGEMSAVEVRIGLRTEAGRTACTGRDLIHEGQHDLVTETVAVAAVGSRAEVGHKIEPEAHGVHAGHVIAELAGIAVAPVFGAVIELGEPPVAEDVRIVAAANALLAAEMVEAPTGIHVGHQFHEGAGFFERIFAGIALQHQVVEAVLQHLRDEFEHAVWVDVAIEEHFITCGVVVPLISEDTIRVGLGAILVRHVLHKRPQEVAAAEEVARNRGGGGLEDFADDLLDMLLGSGDVHVLVITEQRRTPVLLLSIPGEAVGAPTDLMFNHIAGITHATRAVGNLASPGLRDVGKHAAEAVLSHFDGRAHLGGSGGNVIQPAIGGPDIFHDNLVEARRLIDEKLREVAGRNNLSCGTCHKVKILSVLFYNGQLD